MSSARPAQRSAKPKTASARLVLPLFRLLGRIVGGPRYRGLGRAAKLMSRVMPPAIVEIAFEDGSRGSLDILDYYWVRLIFDDYAYEPEMETVLSNLRLDDFVWLDCGANIGYWSLRMAGRLAHSRVVAIEASPPTFAKLEQNARRAGAAILTVNRALSDEAGASLSFVIMERHAAAHLLDPSETLPPSARVVDVQTTTIDEIVSNLDPGSENLPIVIKLDVEGAELAVLRGAHQTINTREVAIIYECHGSDPDCRVTAQMLQDERFDIFSLEGGPQRITSVDEVRRIKVDRTKGYNFLALDPALRHALGAAAVTE